ncbi:MAG: alkaline phosphatase family protein [Thermodesulfobacteriota bacterium]|nr:alkaline phosphatase family protein [Thermodesulfobacteriota bacterium]
MAYILCLITTDFFILFWGRNWSYDNVILGALFVAFLSVLTLSILFFMNSLQADSHVHKDHQGDLLNSYNEKGPKILWIGIDSATWTIIDPMMAMGKLPNLSTLIKRGCSGKLKTFVPTHSPVIWTTKATAKSPEKHGIRDFLIYKIKGISGYLEVKPLDPVISKILSKAADLGLVERRPVTSLDRRALPIWDIVSELGHTVGVSSWFVTDPIEKIDGFMVPEFFYRIGHGQRDHIDSMSMAHPMNIDNDLKNLRSGINKIFDKKETEEEIREEFHIGGSIKNDEKLKFHILKVFYLHDVLRRQVTDHLLNLFDPDMLMVYFHGVDAVQHQFWSDRKKDQSIFKEVIPLYYEYVDSIIGRLMEKISGTKTIFITSDHGHGPVKWYKNLYNKIVGHNKISGSHANGPDGIFIASGHGIKQNVSLQGISVYDIVPTILSILGLPVARDMDGQPISQILDASVSPITYIDSYEGRISVGSGEADNLKEDNEILERLKDLGYIG